MVKPTTPINSPPTPTVQNMLSLSSELIYSILDYFNRIQ